jgi:O-antigen ligase
MLRSRVVLSFILALVLLLAAGNVAWLAEQYGREREESGDSRLQAYAVNWQVTGGRLWFGLGPAGYAVYYMTYLPDQAMATHSNYLDVFSQTGLVGLAAFLATFAALLYTALALYRRVRARRDLLSGFSAALLGGTVATLAAMALGDWVLPFAYTQTIAGFDYALYTWVMLGAGVAVWQMAGDDEWAAA